MNEVVVQDPIDVTNEDNPLNGLSKGHVNQLMRQMKDMIGILESQWDASKMEFELTDTHMKQLYQYNENHRELPEDGNLDAEGYDRFNGLDKLTEEEVFDIFGEEHPIIGVDHTQTMDRIKAVIGDFFRWMASVQEYRQVHDAYVELIETQEEEEMLKLKVIAEEETDPERKLKLMETIDKYYNRKYLDFLKDPLDDNIIKRIVDTFSNKGKIEYWINRTRDKLSQMKVSTKFILEISKFEERFLPEKYHHQNNILLLYFMNTIVYNNNNKLDNSKVIYMIFALDRFVRNTWDENIKERMMNNIIALEDQFIGKLPELKNDKGEGLFYGAPKNEE